MVKKKVVASGLTIDQRKKLKSQIDSFVKKLLKSTKFIGEQIAIEMRYWHQSGSNPYRTNASKQDKFISWNHYRKKCQAKCCKKKIESMRTAVFHHKKRGIKNQHSHKNLVPFHRKCHEKEHNSKLK